MSSVSLVERFLALKLKGHGFRKRGLRFSKAIGDGEVELEAQRSRWSKQQHFLDGSIVYLPQACQAAGVPEGCGIWFRGESVLQARKEEFLQALDDDTVLTDGDREHLLAQLLDEVVLPFLSSVSTISGAEEEWKAGRLEFMAYPKLKDKWEARTDGH